MTTILQIQTEEEKKPLRLSRISTFSHLPTILLIVLLVVLPACVSMEDFPTQKITLDKGPIPTNHELLEKELIQYELNDIQQISERGFFFEDPALEQYLHKVAEPFIKALNIQDKRDFTFKVVRDPTLNAFTGTSGYIYYHSGVFARMRNEAQLAFVLAHEISHAYHRDVLYQDLIRNWWISRTSTKVYDTLFTNPIRFADNERDNTLFLDQLRMVSMGGLGKLFEQRADLFAIEQMVKQGYDPRGAIEILDIMIQEDDYDPREKQPEVYFYSDHPATVERKKYVQNWIDTHQDLIRQSTAQIVSGKQFLENTYRVRQENLKLYLESGRCSHARDSLKLLLSESPKDPFSHYYRGETLRCFLKGIDNLFTRDSPDGTWRPPTPQEKSQMFTEWSSAVPQAYQEAILLDPRFALPYRSLGMHFMEMRDVIKAKEYFNQYLTLEPKARDRRSILHYLEEMGV